MDGIKLSSYQEEILKVYKNEPTNILINALSGSGKSTIIKIILESTKTKNVYLAFNNAIVASFKEKIQNPLTKIYTMHSLAYAIMQINANKIRGLGRINAAKVNLSNYKIHNIIDDILIRDLGRYSKWEERVAIKDDLVELYDLIRVTLSDINVREVNRLIEKHEIYQITKNRSISAITSWLKEINRVSLDSFEKTKEIDFTDMLYITYLKLKSGDWEVPEAYRFNVIGLDEAQDQNKLQLEFLKFIGNPNAKYIFVGDKNQSIYFWRGADSDTFSIIKEEFTPIKELELPITYRCPLSHIEAVKHNFDIKLLPKEDAIQGNIETIEKEDIKEYVKPGDMIISRKNKWLASVIESLLKEGIPITIQDQDLVKSIMGILNKYKKKTEDLFTFKNKIEKEIRETEHMIELFREDNNNLSESFSDQSDSEFLQKEKENVIILKQSSNKVDNLNFILSLLGSFKEKKSSNRYLDFYNYMDSILNSKNSCDTVRLSSVHRAKGLESKNVFVLNEGKICLSDRMPREQRVQEKNLSYISFTRSLENLYLVIEEEV